MPFILLSNLSVQFEFLLEITEAIMYDRICNHNHLMSFQMILANPNQCFEF